MSENKKTSVKVTIPTFQTLLWLMAALFLAFYLYKFYRYLFISSGMYEYYLSENLLHYPGSYMRRSLLGNLFILFPAAYWIFVIKVFYMIHVLLVLGYMIWNRPHLPGLVLFLYMPFGLRLVILDAGGLYRKEVTYYLAIILLTEIFRTKWDRNIKLILTIALGILMILIHESFLFLGLPIIIGLMYYHNWCKKDILVYTVFMFILWLVLIPGFTTEQLYAMDIFFAKYSIDWSSYRYIFFQSQEQMINLTLEYFFKGPMLFYLMLLIPFLYYLRKIRVLMGDLLTILIIQLIAAFFLCLTAFDYGRWFTFVLTSWFIILFKYSRMEGLSEWLKQSGTNRFIFVFSLFALLCYHVPVVIYLDIDYTLKQNFILMHLRKFFIENGH
jgi:hypothetical protein